MRGVLEALEAALVGCRLLADYWAEGEGEAWRSALARCATPAQLAVYVHVLRAAAGEEVAALRAREVTRGQWNRMRRGRTFCPAPGDCVTFLLRAYEECLAALGGAPWDGADAARAFCGGQGPHGYVDCEVADVRYFAGEGKDAWPACTVALRRSSGGGEGALLTITVQCGTTLPDALVDAARFRRSAAPWAAGDAVKMFFQNESLTGGHWYRGECLSQELPAGGDPWESVRVRWDDGEEMQVSPWELRRMDESDE